ncbi:MAG: hypothetical protein QW515_05020, partial [Thermoplasmatales archaeon]
MKTVVFVTPYTYEWIEAFNHSTEGESMTIPDDAYSIEELFDRLDHGLSLGSPAPTFYDDEFESIDDYSSADDPEPDPFYDLSMRKIDRLTYANEQNEIEKEKTRHHTFSQRSSASSKETSGKSSAERGDVSQ